MAKRLTYNEATAIWYARHPEFAHLRDSWQPITCAVCGFLDETRDLALWACPQCAGVIPQPPSLAPEPDEPVAALVDLKRAPTKPTPEQLAAVAEITRIAQETGQYDPPKPTGLVSRTVITKRK